MVTYTLKVVDIRKETEDTVTICFKQPAIRKIKYQAGQYLSLIFRINSRRYVRPYSFSSCPFVDQFLEVTVKRVPNGIVSNHIHDTIDVGDSIEALVPMGDFIYEDKGDTREVYFWGAGSGITPLISLIKHILTSTELKVVLAYGNRSFDTTIFSSTIESFKEKYAERFKVWHFHTQLQIAPENTDVIEGRINSDLILKIVARADVNVIKHYICGPKGLKESVTETLCKLGTSDDRIFTEEFEISKNPTDFVNVTTEYIKINFKSVEYDLEVIKGKSILESALDAGLELPYSCQTGTCNTCKARTINGVIKMVGLSKERSDLLENECLLCCSHPVSDNVYIAI